MKTRVALRNSTRNSAMRRRAPPDRSHPVLANALAAVKYQHHNSQVRSPLFDLAYPRHARVIQDLRCPWKVDVAGNCSWPLLTRSRLSECATDDRGQQDHRGKQQSGRVETCPRCGRLQCTMLSPGVHLSLIGRSGEIDNVLRRRYSPADANRGASKNEKPSACAAR